MLITKQYTLIILKKNGMKRRLEFLLIFVIAMLLPSACNSDNKSNPSTMCDKLPMQDDGIVRLSKIKVNPDYLDEYMKFAVEVGTVSLQTEPGVLTMYAVADKDDPCNITILETYSSLDAYKNHIASKHFQKYKQGTLHMVDSLVLDDVTPLNPANVITNRIEPAVR